MVEQGPLTLWCKVLGKQVKVTLAETGRKTDPAPGLPEGWAVQECLDKDTECFGKDCPFTTDGGQWPFGESEEKAPGGA